MDATVRHPTIAYVKQIHHEHDIILQIKLETTPGLLKPIATLWYMLEFLFYGIPMYTSGICSFINITDLKGGVRVCAHDVFICV